MSEGVKYAFNQWINDGIEDHTIFSGELLPKLYFEDEELEKIRECQEEAFEKVREVYVRYLKMEFQEDLQKSPDRDQLLKLEIEKVQKILGECQDYYIDFLKGYKGFESISGAEYHEIKHWVEKFEKTVKQDGGESLSTLKSYGEGLKNVLQNNKVWIQENPKIRGERIHNTFIYVACNYDYLQWLKSEVPKMLEGENEGLQSQSEGKSTEPSKAGKEYKDERLSHRQIALYCLYTGNHKIRIENEAQKVAKEYGYGEYYSGKKLAQKFREIKPESERRNYCGPRATQDLIKDIQAVINILPEIDQFEAQEDIKALEKAKKEHDPS